MRIALLVLPASFPRLEFMWLEPWAHADLAFLARELLRDPYWPHHAAKALGQPVLAPVQCGRVF